MKISFKTSIVTTDSLSNHLLQASMNKQLDDDVVQQEVRVEESTSYLKKISLGIIRDKIKLKAIKPFNQEAFDTKMDLLADELRGEIDIERNLYRYQALNNDQKKIFDYVKKNPTAIITIQAGPGCGKSFVLKTIAHSLRETPSTAIIYKHDLLHSFKNCAQLFTVCRFIMHALKISYYDYLSLDMLISSKITAFQFISAIVNIVRESKFFNIAGTRIFLDEYTVITKPTLVTMLMILDHHKIGTILCGDRNQLQNIHNSQHAILSSYSIAQAYSAREFNLTKNERCIDESYNEIIDHFAKYSSDKNLDDYAYALIAAIFLKQTTKLPEYNCVHLAATHQELANLQHMMVCNNEYPTNFYKINKSNVKNNSTAQLKRTATSDRYMSQYNEIKKSDNPNRTPNVEKFLPYIPLVIGGRYYIQMHSEYCQGTLVGYSPEHQTITVVKDTNPNEHIVLSQGDATKVIFEPHLDFLLRGHDDERVTGKIYAYPIYPANFMSIHKCQGCTIRNNVNLMLTKTNYQGLYVALSRVTSPDQIHRVVIPNQITHLISTIINFEEHCRLTPIPFALIRDRMVNYKLYESKQNLREYARICMQFIECDDELVRRQIRRELIDKVTTDPNIKIRVMAAKEAVCPENYNQLALSRMVKYNDVFLALATINPIDSNVWLHEFMLHNRDMEMFLPDSSVVNKGKMSDFKKFNDNILSRLANWNNGYTLEINTVDYIRSVSIRNYHTVQADIDANAKYCIERSEPFTFLETTEFCCKVYHKYEKNEEITLQWLIEEMNEMLDKIEVTTQTTEVPVKVNNLKRTFTESDFFVKRTKKISVDDIEKKIIE